MKTRPVALELALWLPKRLRQFVDAEARRRDHELKEVLATSAANVRAELSSLATEHDVAGRKLEALTVTVERLSAELAELREKLSRGEPKASARGRRAR